MCCSRFTEHIGFLAYCCRFVSFQCLEEAGGDWNEVSKCVDGDEGKKLQLIAENQTKEISQPRLENVPTIVFNNVCNLLRNEDYSTCATVCAGPLLF